MFVFSTHYPEDRVPAGANQMSLLEQTARTSRNIGGGALVNWMSGGISLQVWDFICFSFVFCFVLLLFYFILFCFVFLFFCFVFILFYFVLFCFVLFSFFSRPSLKIEHHLFPTMPRSRLIQISPRVRSRLQKLGYPYLETSIYECMKANIACLQVKNHE